MVTATKEAESVRAAHAGHPDQQMISQKTLRRTAWVAGLMLLAFLVGYIPAWLSASGYEYERNVLENQARVHSIRHTLASAIVHADRGRFDDARTEASNFFSALRAEYDDGSSALDPKAKEDIGKMLARRDDVITMLARGERAGADMLADWHFYFETANRQSQ